MSRFVARGNAVAFAGWLDGARGPQPIDVQNNSASLPVTGGKSQAQLLNFELPLVAGEQPILSIVEGHTLAQTTEHGPVEYVTEVSANVLSLTLFNRLKVSHVNAALKSTHTIGGAEPAIVISGATIEGLQCWASNGTVYDLVVDWTYDPCNAKPTAAAYFGTSPSECETKSEVTKVCTLRWKDTQNPEVTIHNKDDGSLLIWPDHGTVYVGQMLITKGLRRLTLLRFELPKGTYTPYTMSASSGEVESNGSEVYP